MRMMMTLWSDFILLKVNSSRVVLSSNKVVDWWNFMGTAAVDGWWLAGWLGGALLLLLYHVQVEEELLGGSAYHCCFFVSAKYIHYCD